MIRQQLSMFDELGQETGREVRRAPIEDVLSFILNIHYARRVPSITDAFGLYKDGELIGVVTYGIPASPNLCMGVAGEKYKDNVKELNRLVIKPGCNGENNASYLVSHSLKMLKNGTIVVSYADTAWTHVGYIYQACNFLYTGLSAERTDTFQPTGKHSRHAEQKDKLIRQTRSRKHRYIFIVGDKRIKREIRKALNYEVIEKYPKGDERRYDPFNPIISDPVRVYRKGTTNGEGVSH